MPISQDDLTAILRGLHPYDALPPERLAWLTGTLRVFDLAGGEVIYRAGSPLEGLYILRSGEVEVTDAHGAAVSLLGPGNSFGERGLMRDGVSVTSARALVPTRLLLVPRAAFDRLIAEDASARAFFDRARKARAAGQNDLATASVETFMAPGPLTCAPDTPVQEAARQMRARHISSLCVLEGEALAGIVTIRDLSGKVVAEGLPPDTPVAAVMTRNPITLTTAP
jgi:Predicted signal-transduction protein containing cAMP-binding and CBS domains